MKIFFAFIALAAASTTSQPTTTAESTTAEVEETDCGDAKQMYGLVVDDEDFTEDEISQMKENCNQICDAEGLENCDDEFHPQEEEEEEVVDEEADEEEMDCSGWREFTVNLSSTGLENWEEYDEVMADYASEDAFWTAAQAECTAVCVEEGQSDCSDLFVDEAAEACAAAQKDLAESTDALEKIALQATCLAACAEIEGETCGFLVNGLSFALFAILAIFKY